MGNRIETYENGILVSTVDMRTLEEIKTKQKNNVNDFRGFWITQGYIYNGNIFDTDQQSLFNINSMATAASVAASWPKNFTWRDKNNIDVPFLTPSEFVIFATTLMNFVNNSYKYSWRLKASIDNLNTISEVENFDITTGWPTNNSNST